MKKRAAPRRKCCACPEMLHVRKLVCPGCNTNQKTREREVTENTITIADIIFRDTNNRGYDTAESSDADKGNDKGNDNGKGKGTSKGNDNDNDKGTSKKRKRSRKGIEYKDNTQPHSSKKPKP
jgi:hypothetical protein